VRGISGPPREVTIPAPWGRIAGRAWGDPGGRPVLGLHGWLDNAGTFDHLAPLLSDDLYLVSIDQPGHGLTSHYPPGLQYKLSDAFVHLRRVLEHLGWERAAVLGHSMGGGVGLWYAAMFPEQIDRVVCIDLLSFGSVALSKHVESARKSVLATLATQAKMEEPTLPRYTWEDACGRAFMASNLINGLGSITKESVETLMRRGLVELEDGKFTWSADLRLRIPTAFNMLPEMTTEFASKVQCPHLFIKGSDSKKYMADEHYERLLRVFQQHNPTFQYRELPGGHHLHLNTPQPVADTVNTFLAQQFQQPDPEGRAQFDVGY